MKKKDLMIVPRIIELNSDDEDLAKHFFWIFILPFGIILIMLIIGAFVGVIN